MKNSKYKVHYSSRHKVRVCATHFLLSALSLSSALQYRQLLLPSGPFSLVWACLTFSQNHELHTHTLSCNSKVVAKVFSPQRGSGFTQKIRRPLNFIDHGPACSSFLLTEAATALRIVLTLCVVLLTFELPLVSWLQEQPHC